MVSARKFRLGTLPGRRYEGHSRDTTEGLNPTIQAVEMLELRECYSNTSYISSVRSLGVVGVMSCASSHPYSLSHGTQRSNDVQHKVQSPVPQ